MRHRDIIRDTRPKNSAKLLQVGTHLARRHKYANQTFVNEKTRQVTRSSQVPRVPRMLISLCVNICDWERKVGFIITTLRKLRD